MKKKLLKLLKNRKFIVIIVVITLVFTYGVYEINEQLNNFKYKIINFLEKNLETKVKFSHFKGNWINEIHFYNIKIYNQFKENQLLIKAKTLSIKFNWKQILFNKNIPNENIHRIHIQDVKLFIDEHIHKQKLTQFFIKKNKITKKTNQKLKIIFKNLEIESNFTKIKYLHFKLNNIHGEIKKNTKNISFEFKGFFKGDKKYFYSTQSNFQLIGNNNTKTKTIKGILNLESLKYLGYNFKGVAFDYNIKNKKINFKAKPTSYAPFFNKLPIKYKKSYKSKQPYYYLLNLTGDFFIKTNDLYINFPVQFKNEASRGIIQYYLNKNSKIKPWLKYLKNDFNYQPFGKAFFKIHKGKLVNFSIKIKKTSGVFHKDDYLNFIIIGYLSSLKNKKYHFWIKNINYTSLYGSLKGSIEINQNQKNWNIDLQIKNLLFSKFNKDSNPQKINLPIKLINLKENVLTIKHFLKQKISTQIIAKYIKKNLDFSLKKNKIGKYDIQNIHGKYFYNFEKIKIYLTGINPINYKAIIEFDKNNFKKIKLDLIIYRLKYKFLQKILNSSLKFKNFNLKGHIKGIIHTNNFSKSILKGKLKLINSSLNYIKLNYEKQKIWLKEIATIQFKYKNSILYIQNVIINDFNINFKGIISFNEKNIYSEITLTYLNYPIYIEGHFNHLEKNIYKSKINIIYDQFKGQLSSIEGQLTLNPFKIEFNNSKIKHQKKHFTLNGYIKWKNNQLHSNILLKSKFTSNNDVSKIYGIKGIIKISNKNNFTKKININLKLQHDYKFIQLIGNFYFLEKKINSKLLIKYSSKNKYEININSNILKRFNGMDLILNIKYEKKTYILNISYYRFKEGLKLETKINGLFHPISFQIFFRNNYNNKIDLYGFIQIAQEKINTKGYIHFYGQNIISFLDFSYKFHHVKLEGYISHNQGKYFPYYQLIYNSPYRKKPFIIFWEGKLINEKKEIIIQTIINKNISLVGKFKKYSELSIEIFFDQYKIDNTNIILFNDYNTPKKININLTKKGLKIEGIISLKGLAFFLKQNIILETQFLYEFLFQKNNKASKIQLDSLLLKHKEKILFSSQGKLSYNKKKFKLSLNDQNGKSNITINYNKKSNKMKALIYFHNLNLKNFNDNISGKINSIINLEGDLNNPYIKIQNLELNEGKYNNNYFNINFSLIKEKNKILISKAKIKINNQIIYLKNLKYIIPNTFKNIYEIYTKIEAKSYLSIDNLIIKKGEKKLILEKMIYQKGNKTLLLERFFNSSKSNIFDFLINLKKEKSLLSHFLFKDEKGKFYIKKLKWKGLLINFNIQKLQFTSGKNWRFDSFFKWKGYVFGNIHKGQMHVISGRDKEYAEINFYGSRFTINNKKLNNLRFSIESKKYYWQILENNIKINGHFIINPNYWQYEINYAGEKTISFNSKGKWIFKNGFLDIIIKYYNYKISLSHLAPLILKTANGQIISNIHISGHYTNPKIEGYIDFSKGNLKLKNSNAHFNNSYLRINLTKNKKYSSKKLKQNLYYNHILHFSSEYNNSLIKINGVFNLDYWSITEFELDIHIPKKQALKKINFQSNLLKYKGNIWGNITIFKKNQNTILQGQIYPSNADIDYIGRKKNKIKFLDLLELKSLNIIFEDKVTINLGKENFSIGELTLKKDSFLQITKKILQDNTSKFYLHGKIESKKGNFNYLGNEFKVSEVKILWNGPKNPSINLKAITKVRDENNRLINVFLKSTTDWNSILSLYKTDSLQKRNIILNSLSSIPTKNPNEIAILLGLVDAKNQNGKNNLINQQGKIANAAFNLLLIKPLERKLRNIFGGIIDTVNIKQNLITNTIFRSFNEQTINSTLTNNLHPLSNTEITLGKYLTQDLYLSSGVLLLQDMNPSTKKKGINTIYKLSLESDLLPIFGVNSETISLQNVIEYHYNQTTKKNPHEFIFQLQLVLEF